MNSRPMSNIGKQTKPELREKFERWWEVNFHDGNAPRHGWEYWRDGDGYVEDCEFQWCWEAWQAAHSDKLEAAEKRIAELEALKAKTVWSDIDMSDADCFTITRLHEIIYASELKWPEPKLLARFMHDVKQLAGTVKGE